MMFSALCLVIAFIFQADAKTTEIMEKEKLLLDSLFDPSKYDPGIRPSGPNETGPLLVHVNTYIRSISNIDDVNMEFEVQLTFRQSWIDPRLKYSKTDYKRNYLTLLDLKKIWIPDAFFSNEKSGHFHDIITPNVLIRITPEGIVLYSTRISLKLSCLMDLKNYPFDNQVCSIIFASYGYTTKDLVFFWKSGDPIQILKNQSSLPATYRNKYAILDGSASKHLTKSRNPGPVQVTKNLNVRKFILEEFYSDYCTSRTNTGEYSCLKIDLVFKRQLGHSILQVFLPTILLTLISWVPLWLDYRTTETRIAMWLVVVLTMFILTSNVQSSLPATSYNKAIDVWLGVCLTFLCGVLIELVIVAYIVKQEKSRKSHGDIAEDNAVTPSITTGKDEGFSIRFTYLRNMFRRYPSTAGRIDLGSRILFPVSFSLFNLIYWLSYAH